MNFEIWHSLNYKDDYTDVKNDLERLLATTVNVKETEIDNEGVFKAKVRINTIEDLTELNYLLDDDIVIFGSDKDILMTVKTMQDLGLDLRM